jgi:hypothetical protein
LYHGKAAAEHGLSGTLIQLAHGVGLTEPTFLQYVDDDQFRSVATMPLCIGLTEEGKNADARSVLLLQLRRPTVPVGRG